MKFNSEQIEGEALRLSNLNSINNIRYMCHKYNYKWYNPRKEHFNNL